MSVFTVDAKSFAIALSRVLPFAATDTYPTLECVQMKRNGDQLTLGTTDRFRAALLVTTVEWADDADSDWSLSLPREVAKRVVSEWKSARLCRVSLDCSQDASGKCRVVVEDTFGRSVGDTFTAVSGVPDLGKVMSNDVPVDRLEDSLVQFNADYLLDFAKSRPTANTPMEVRWPELPSRPIHVAIGDDFLGVLMPQRPKGGSLVAEVLRRVGGDAG